VEEHRWGLRSALAAEERRKGGGWERDAESNIRAAVGIEDVPSPAEEHKVGTIEREMK